jgi:hypothetical protein
MRIKSYNDPGTIHFQGFAQQALMPQMDSIEVTDGHYTILKILRTGLQPLPHLHRG